MYSIRRHFVWTDLFKVGARRQQIDEHNFLPKNLIC